MANPCLKWLSGKTIPLALASQFSYSLIWSFKYRCIFLMSLFYETNQSRHRIVISVLAILCSQVFATINAVDIIDLGVLNGQSASFGYAISDNGDVVVGDSGKGFIWSNGQEMSELEISPHGLSGDGTVVAGDSGSSAYYWTKASGLIDLGSLAGDTSSSAKAISSDGKIIVGASKSSTNRTAFRWTATGGMESLGVMPGYTFSQAWGISGKGEVIVGRNWANGINFHAFRWSSATGMQDLAIPTGFTASTAYAVSRDGGTITGYLQGAEWRAFRYDDISGMVPLGVISGDSMSFGYCVSPDGKVIGGESDSNDRATAVIWDSNNETRDLYRVLSYNQVQGIENWSSLTWTSAITGDSISGYNITGGGIVNGQEHAFLIRGLTSTVPEPSSILYGSIAIIAGIYKLIRIK